VSANPHTQSMTPAFASKLDVTSFAFDTSSLRLERRTTRMFGLRHKGYSIHRRCRITKFLSGILVAGETSGVFLPSSYFAETTSDATLQSNEYISNRRNSCVVAAVLAKSLERFPPQHMSVDIRCK
jgi:hypothetical protein